MFEIILKEREVREKIVEIINNSKLPAIIIKPILNDLLNQVNSLSEQQYSEALKHQEQMKKKIQELKGGNK
jgi:hypothetical protein